MDSEAAKFITVVVFPTPPFWFMIASVVGDDIYLLISIKIIFESLFVMLLSNL